MGMKGIGMFEIVEMGREDGDGGIGMEITNSACTLRRVYWHVPHDTSFTRFRSPVSYLKRMAAEFLLSSILEIEKMYYKNIKEFTKQKPEFELKFGFEPGSVRFKKILKFAEP